MEKESKIEEIELFINNEEEDGVFAISLVESPAIEENFIALSNYKMDLKVVDKERRIVVGLALVPDKRIYRKMKPKGAKEAKEFNIYFSSDTVSKTAELYMKNLHLNNVTSEHEKPVQGASVIESWIVEDTDKDKTALYNLNAVKGSWAVMMKIYNDEEWEKIQGGEYKGFSIEGLYDGLDQLNAKKELSDEERLAQIEKLLND